MARIDSIINDSNVDRLDRLLGSSSEGGTRNYKIQDILSLIGISDVDDLQDTLTQKADLVNGLVASSQLPSFVDEVVEADDFASLPETGALGRIYITIDNNKTYRWSGSTYIEVKDDHAVWGSIDGILSNQTDLQNALNAKGNLTGGNTWNGTQAFSSNILLQSIGATTQPFEIYFDGYLNFKHNSNTVALLSTTGDFILRNSAGFNARLKVDSVTTQRDFTLPDASGTFALTDVDNNFTASQTITGQGGPIGLALENTSGNTYRVLSDTNGDFILESDSGFIGNFYSFNTSTGHNFVTTGGFGLNATFGGDITTIGASSKISGFQLYAHERTQVGAGSGTNISILQREFLQFIGTGTKIISATQGDLQFNSNSFTFLNKVAIQGGNAQIDLYDRTSNGDNVRFDFSGGQYRFRMLDDSASTNVVVSTVDLSNYLTTFNYDVDITGTLDVSGVTSLNDSIFIEDNMHIRGTSTGGAIGFNRNTDTGALLNPTYGAFQIQSDTSGRIVIQTYAPTIGNNTGDVFRATPTLIELPKNTGITGTLDVSSTITASSYKIGVATVLSGSGTVQLGSAGATSNINLTTSTGNAIQISGLDSTFNGNVEVGTDTSNASTVLRRQDTGDYIQLYRSGINVGNISASSQGLRLWGLNSVVINPESLNVDFYVYSDVNTAILVDGANGNTTFGNDILVTTAHRLYDNGDYRAVGNAPIQTYDTTGGNSGLRDYININTATNHIFRRLVDVGGTDTLLQEFFGNGKIHFRGTAQSSVPTGTSTSGFLNIGNQTAGTFDYGMSFGVLTSGKGFIQQKRFSGTATEYALQINPLGGFVEFYDNVEFYGSGWNSGDNFYFRTSGAVGSETLSINFNDASVASTKLIEFTEDLVETNVQVRLSNLPTSSTGLSAGDLWNDAGTVKIV